MLSSDKDSRECSVAAQIVERYSLILRLVVVSEEKDGLENAVVVLVREMVSRAREDV